MWYLESFDKETEQLVREYPLIGLDTAALQKLFGFGDTYEIDGVDYPPEAGGYDVPPLMVPELAKYIADEFVMDDSYDYQVEYFQD